jgi:hypothetical protein
MSHFNFSSFQNACLAKEPLFTSEHTPARNPRLHPQIGTVVHLQAAGKIFTPSQIGSPAFHHTFPRLLS